MSEAAQTRRITETLMRHGYYDLIEVEPDCVLWAEHDAEAVLCAPLNYQGIDEALLDTGLHDPDECRVVCINDLLEVLGATDG